ncbi:hypothetical protein HPP92_028103 [Vanilla planifolia]|uniref:Protein kinase domain-containing protein n=1 Tax=Vanilla planifolia TaxID=51239 RepID=A0A835U4U9_VANPL|nr:hypothetical protein HPP92_028103 [Vanilla planifolia]
MLQVLQNIGDLGTGNLIPSPPPPPFPPPFPSAYSSVGSSTKSTKIVASSAAAGSVSLLGIVAFVGFLIRRRMRKRKLFSTDIAAIEVIPTSPALPTEGLYIFTKAELKQATNGYDDRLLLGSGGAGKVYLGKLPSGHQVAIKRIYREKKLSEFYREVEVLAKLRHRNLTTLVGYCLGERDEHALVYEYMAGGNLARALAGEVGLPWTRRLHIAAEVAAGLAYLHDFLEGAVVHRDVKPTNILLTEDSTAKLSDFGVSRIVPPEGSHVSTEVRGTLGYVDPESFSVGHVSETADVYSFGVVLLELVTGMKAVVPTPSGGAESIVHAARAAVAATSDVAVIVDRRLGPSWDRPTIRSTFELARRCVKPYKEERPAMREVLSELRAFVADLEARIDGGTVAALSSVTEGGMSPSPSPMSTTTEEQTWSGSDSCS